MKTLLKISVILTIIAGSLSTVCKSETSRKVQNIETFARLYGYARWFHPSDEAQEIDWDKFAVLGVKKVETSNQPKNYGIRYFNFFRPSCKAYRFMKQINLKNSMPIFFYRPK